MEALKKKYEEEIKRLKEEF